MIYPGLTTDCDYEYGLTAPYPPNFEKGRTNRGFSDLRGRPDLAAKVAEAENSPALRALLIALADKDSPFFSLGCDVGEHEEPMDDGTKTPVAGGYIDIICADYDSRGDDEYRRLADAIEESMSPDAQGYSWAINFGIKPCCFQVDGYKGDDVVVALCIGFYSAGSTAAEARANREVMLDSLLSALKGDAVQRLRARWAEDDEDYAALG